MPSASSPTYQVKLAVAQLGQRLDLDLDRQQMRTQRAIACAERGMTGAPGGEVERHVEAVAALEIVSRILLAR